MRVRVSPSVSGRLGGIYACQQGLGLVQAVGFVWLELEFDVRRAVAEASGAAACVGGVVMPRYQLMKQFAARIGIDQRMPLSDRLLAVQADQATEQLFEGIRVCEKMAIIEIGRAHV